MGKKKGEPGAGWLKAYRILVWIFLVQAALGLLGTATACLMATRSSAESRLRATMKWSFRLEYDYSPEELAQAEAALDQIIEEMGPLLELADKAENPITLAPPAFLQQGITIALLLPVALGLEKRSLSAYRMVMVHSLAMPFLSLGLNLWTLRLCRNLLEELIEVMEAFSASMQAPMENVAEIVEMVHMFYLTGVLLVVLWAMLCMILYFCNALYFHKRRHLFGVASA